MQISAVRAALGACLFASAFATPTPVHEEPVTRTVVNRQAFELPIISTDQLHDALDSFRNSFESVAAGVEVGKAIFTNIVPAPGPTAIPQVIEDVQKITSANPGALFQNAAEILAGGLAGGSYTDIANAYLRESSSNNINLRPAPGIFPKANSRDAPYSLREADLRKVIYFPPGYTYGRKPPVIFIPGTGARAGSNFAGNLAKLVEQNNLGDVVYINIPGNNLGDIQLAAEYTAYAINYVSAISRKRKVSIISWSQGSIDSQWALKYWRSTRSKVNDKIAISPDYHGTILAQALCPGFSTSGCTAAIAQQNYNSTFINTLRNNGGDSAYVPTTNIYSIFDEIVQPQEDPNASGALNDARGVGVNNVELQSACTAVLPGGSVLNEHAGVLINALAYALVADALTHDGPGQLSRINVARECSRVAAPGLGLPDVLNAYAQIPLALAEVLKYLPKVAKEPPIKAYAR